MLSNVPGRLLFETNFIALCISTKYDGVMQPDSFEPDYLLSNATTLNDTLLQSHTIYPVGDVDYFKIPINGDTTFELIFQCEDGISRLDSTMFRCVDYWASQYDFAEVQIGKSYDSANCRIYPCVAAICDTAYIGVSAQKYLPYSITLRR